jgi:hypothetical protein
MTLPSLLLGVTISTLFGAVFHLVRGGGLGRLLLYLILGWVGFWAGHFLAEALGWRFDLLGALHMGTASIFSVIFLVVGHWLSLVEVKKN